jgi:putative acyl-CoA dehydrogenase
MPQAQERWAGGDTPGADAGYATHEVLNQPPGLVGYDAFGGDRALVETVGRLGAGWAAGHLHKVGQAIGSGHVQQLAHQANRHTPELRTHDRFGNRIDEVEFHPAWHELMRLCFGHGLHAFAWTHADREGAQVARAAISYLWNQGENGVCCPASMTYAAVPMLRIAPALAAEWEGRVLSTRYDARQMPAAGKTGATVGMAMTEKQGGSDLRATQTTATAVAAGGSGEAYRITGHKWFFSVPQSDLFFTLARTAAGVSCFAVPGWLPDGARNRLLIQRLKDKCGNRSNASAEIEYRGAWGRMVGEDGRGIRTLIEMAHLTRLDCALSSAGLMRQAVSQAIHHCRHRTAFQLALADQPVMQRVLADLALEAEAAMAIAFRCAAAVDASVRDAAEARLARILVPVAKYWVCRRAPALVAEALECHGGNGFVEDHLLARLYREAPLNGIWEGSGNVICLDVLRSIERDPDCLGAWLDDVRRGAGGDRRLDDGVRALEPVLADRARLEGRARAIVGAMATLTQASLLVRFAPHAVADAFCASRLSDDLPASARAFGALAAAADARAVIARADMG